MSGNGVYKELAHYFSSSRPPYAEKGIWLVRPDGYVALAAHENDVREVDAYLANLSKPAAASAD
jgi:hypothetical protein